MKTKFLYLIVLFILVFPTSNLVASQVIQVKSSNGNIVCDLFEMINKNINQAMFWVLFATLIILVFYTHETRLIARSTDETNTFNAVTRIHERIASSESYKRRGYLHAEFDDHFNKATNDFKSFLNTNPGLDEDKKLEKFNKFLAQQGAPLINARDAVEMTLNDFDIIALTYFLEVKAAKKLAIAYRTVLKKTAEHILPFVKLQQELRPNEHYKWPYLYLLKELGDILTPEQVKEFKLISRTPDEILKG